jgi:WD40 repeat protein
MDGTVRLWDWSGAPVATFNGHAAPVLACAYTSSGRCIVSGGEDQFVRVWDPAVGGQIAEYWTRTAVESVAHRPETGFLGVGDRQGKFHLIELLGPGAGLL